MAEVSIAARRKRAEKERALIRISATKLTRDVQKMLDENPEEQRALQAKLQRLEESIQKLQRLDREMMEVMIEMDVEEAEISEDMEKAEEFMENLACMRLAMEEVVNPPSQGQAHPAAESSHSGTGSSNSKKEYKSNLPKIPLISFSGHLKEWIGWWAQFKSQVHDNEHFTVNDKFRNLRKYVVENSEAFKVVTSYPASDENYPLVIDDFKRRFGDDKLQRQYYVRELLSLVKKRVKGDGVATLFYKLDSHTRALVTLGVSAETSAEFLYPMVESCLPKQLLEVWMRHDNYGKDESKGNPPKSALSYLIDFLKKEVQNEEQRKLIIPEEVDISQKPRAEKRKYWDRGEPTVAGLMEGKVNGCIFCNKNHRSEDCRTINKLSLFEKMKILRRRGACFRCFDSGHGVNFCESQVKCPVCGDRHPRVMCPGILTTRSNDKRARRGVNQASMEFSYCGEVRCDDDVLLKTVIVKVKANGREMMARVLFDEGSQTSYISSFLARELSLTPFGEKKFHTIMIDGTVSGLTSFPKHEVALYSLSGNKMVKMVLKERKRIGGVLPRARCGKYLEDLKKIGIDIVDHLEVNARDVTDILIGGEYRERLMTGNRKHIGNGTYAVESVFGWMLCGPLEKAEVSLGDMSIQGYLSGDISQLWSLELLGIRDKAEQESRNENDREIKRKFLEKVSLQNGRYSVGLPWIFEGVKENLAVNRAVSEKRLLRVTDKLQQTGKLQIYDEVFGGWEKEGIIQALREVGGVEELLKGHFIPHRPVFKESETTPVRPVFDASCRVGRSRSLNQCLEKGPNMLEKIPSILLRFRENEIGVTSDIRKAFQMIGVNEEDRKFQRFLWWKNGKIQIFEHSRVVFGLNCSPFILASILEHHLNNVREEWKAAANVLSCSLYVDNCVTSFKNMENVEKFRKDSMAIMATAEMELRQWEYSGVFSEGKEITTVLGMKWDKERDMIFCSSPKNVEMEMVTKRKVLSLVSQIFDPIGFTAPALLRPKLMLQEAWAVDLGWDEEWKGPRVLEFLKWVTEVKLLEEVRIPRRVICSSKATLQLHLFTDGSEKAYAGVVFIRVDDGIEVKVQLVAAKSRVAPLDKKSKGKVTIPRLELMGCLIGSRLLVAVKEALSVQDLATFQWSDSTTALAWIQREREWGAFVSNRAKEINGLVQRGNWRHVPGKINPADLPSRGCSFGELLESKWWEGPAFLKLPESKWPNQKEVVNEEAVDRERKKTSTVAVECVVVEPKFSSYLANVRVRAWVRRFIENSSLKNWEMRNRSRFHKIYELRRGERDVLKMIQAQSLPETKYWKKMEIIQGEDEIIRVKSRLLFKDDTENFIFPILLPKNHPLVTLLILYVHRTNSHSGVQGTLGKLREKYWILQGKKTVGRALRGCEICKRFTVKNLTSAPAPLPKDRVSTVFAFQVTGVDMIGYLNLKGGDKAWIVIYTCAVYRGIHLDLVTSLSTETFLGSLERFIHLIGRPSRLWSDSGTNFIGARNLMKMLDWEKVTEELGVREIQWTFNPPSAPWWGGWWERLVRSVKELLRRMLGRAKLSEEEMRTCLAAVTGAINDRPLTTLTEDENDLTPLTPRMFMRDLPVSGFPEGKELHGRLLQEAYRKLQTIKEALRARFRKEYLGLLVQNKSEKRCSTVKVGDVVLVGSDDKKRFEWPLGRIVKLCPGRDGKIRVVEVKVSNQSKDIKDFGTHVLTRPLERIYPLEVTNGEIPVENGDVGGQGVDMEARLLDAEGDPPGTLGKFGDNDTSLRTRSGRKVKKPLKYGEWNY